MTKQALVGRPPVSSATNLYAALRAHKLFVADLSGYHLQVTASDIIRCSAKELGIGQLVETEALFYLECAFSCHIQTSHRPASLSAACLWLAIRMHLLPITMNQVAAAVGEEARLTLKLFHKVAVAAQQNPPATDFTKFALHGMGKIPHVCASTKMQV